MGLDSQRALDIATDIRSKLSSEGLPIHSCRERRRLLLHIANDLRRDRETYQQLAAWIVQRHIERPQKNVKAA
jgi:hypothetical protein